MGSSPVCPTEVVISLNYITITSSIASIAITSK
jgi:hypothetical protein